jgi:polyisoprenoid-binding protein YceI
VDKSKKNVVKFISDAPVEDFEGVTNSIDGYIFNKEDKLDGSKLYFEVDLNTLDTDIGLRNRHMRENYLETDKYPLASYTGNIVKMAKLEDDHYKATAKGKFKVHGVERDMTIEADIYVYDDVLHVKSQFEVALTDHKIDVPSIMFVKIDENMDVRVDFFLKEVSK